jgi:ligand-binding SRPBCC domain-containing protein
MQDQILHKTTIVNAPLEKVFDFFSDAKNLETITPPFLQFKILNQSTSKIQKGTKFTYRLKIHGVPIKWTSLIEEWVPNSHFVDSQLSGPYKKWRHLHIFKSTPEGTWMEDTVNYRVHLGLFGQWLTGSWVRKDVESIFAFRETKVRSIFHDVK